MDLTSKRTPPPTVLQRLPWWLSVLLGATCVVLGIVLSTKPFASLGVLVILVAISFLVTAERMSLARTSTVPCIPLTHQRDSWRRLAAYHLRNCSIRSRLPG